MKSVISFATGALLLAQTLAHPLAVAKRQNIEDTDILTFALTLEHLENVFYKRALTTLSEQQFIDAGYDAKYYSDIKYIAHDEESHVIALSAALTAAGVTPNKACQYEFPFTDVPSFITLSSVLESVGTSAYLGAAGFIKSKDYLTVAGSILVVEAYHTSLQRSARGLVPAANPYGTPLGPNPVYSLAAAFIKSCPPENSPLPFTAFPPLTLNSGLPLAAGTPAQFSIPYGDASGKFATFVSGLATTSVPIEGSGPSFTVPLPPGTEGQSYVFVTKTNVTGGPGTLTDAVIINGPAIIEATPASPTYDVTLE